MNIWRTRARLLAAVSVLVMIVTAGPALAGNGRPDERVRFTDVFSDVDPFFAAACGVDTVLVDGISKVDISVYEDGSARIHDNTKLTFTNPDTGDQVYLTWSNYVWDAGDTVTVDGDIVTIVFEATFIGNPQMWRVPGDGVIVRDAGQITIRTTLVFDESVPPDHPDHLVSFDEEFISVNGPHPFADQGFDFTPDQAARLCEGIGGAVV